MAIHYRDDGQRDVISFKDPIVISELQALVGGYVQMVVFDDGSCLFVDEEGRLKGKSMNAAASVLCMSKGQLHEIVGAAVYLDASEAKWFH